MFNTFQNILTNRIQLYYTYIAKGVSYGKEIDYSKKKI